MATEEGLRFLEDIDIDVLKFHWYPGALSGDKTPWFEDYQDYKKSVIIGEYPVNLPESHLPIQVQIDSKKIAGAAYWRAFFHEGDTDRHAGKPQFIE